MDEDENDNFHFANIYDIIQDAWRHELNTGHYDRPHNHHGRLRTLITRILNIVLMYIIAIIVLAFFYIQAMETITFIRNKSVVLSTKYAWVSFLVILTVAICVLVDIWLEVNGVIIFAQAREDGWVRIPEWAEGEGQ
jgi:hypothetical protein